MSEGFLTNVVFVTGKTNDVATAKSVQTRTATEWTTRSSWDNTQWGKSWWLRKRGKTSSRSQSSWKAGVSFHYQFDSNSILFLQRDNDRNSRWHIHLTFFKSVYCSFQASKRGFKNASAMHKLFENHPKCLIWIFQFGHFPSIFILLKLTCLVTLFDRKLDVFKNSPNWAFLAFLINFCPLKM